MSDERPRYVDPRPRIAGTLRLHFAGARPRVVVEPDGSGFAVTAGPIGHRRWFAIAGDALHYAELVAGEVDGRVLDRTGLVA